MQEFIPEIISGVGGFILGNLIWLINYSNKTNQEGIESPVVEEDKIGGAGKRWTDFDTRFLIEHSDLPNQAIAESLNRTSGAIASKRNDLGINTSSESKDRVNPNTTLPNYEISKIMKKIDLNDYKPSRTKLEPEPVVRIYLSNLDDEEIGAKYGVSRKTPSRIRRKRDWSWLTNQVDKIINQETQQIAEEDYNIEDILDHIDLSQLVDSGYRKLDPEEIIRIYLSNEDKETLGKIFGCSPTNINNVRNKSNWSWLTDQIDDILNNPNKRIDLEPSQRNRSFFND